MSQRLIASFFLPQKASKKSEESTKASDPKTLKRPIEIDDDDHVCTPVKKRRAVIESDDEGCSMEVPEQSDELNEPESDRIEFSTKNVDEEATTKTSLRKTALRKKKNKTNIMTREVMTPLEHVACPPKFELKSVLQRDDKLEKSSPEVKCSEEIANMKEEKNLKEEKKPIHSFFAKKVPAKKSLSPTKNDVKVVGEVAAVENKIVLKQQSSGGMSYDPSADDYDPIKDACWVKDQRVPYLALAKTFEEIEKVSARLKSIEILSNFLCSVIILSPLDLVPSVYLCLNKLAPAYEGIELGIGDTLLIKAIAQTTGRPVDKIKSDVREKGDVGLVAEASRSTQKTMFTTNKLTIASVFKNLQEVAKMSGHSSMAKKTDKIKSMFVVCEGPEARYLIRSLSGKLRIGMAEQSVLQAIAQAFVLTSDEKKMSKDALKKKVEEAALIIKTSYCECPNYDKILPLLLSHPLDKLPLHCTITPGIPLKPMLAHPTKGIHEVLSKFEGSEFVCEYKYDGERAQIHILENGEVSVFSRNQENNTSKYPDVTSRIAGVAGKNESLMSGIIDAEVVAWDSVNKQILPFQVLSTRKRKDADLKEIKVQVCIYAFDLLYLNGESLVRSPLRKRQELLHKTFTEVEGEFMFAKSMVSSSMEDVAEFLEESIKGSSEGLMVKTLDEEATYEIAKRSHNWLKLKKDYLDGVGDTMDLVVIGGFHGTGKRTGKFGGFLLACYDAENEEYQSICKIGTGFTDSDLEQHSNFFKNHTIDKPKNYYRFDSTHCPDTWFDAVQVWEVKAADLSLSPVHKAALGLVDEEKGISLRFPRFLRIRDDKKPEEGTDSSQVAAMYKSQDQIVSQSKSKSDNEDDY